MVFVTGFAEVKSYTAATVDELKLAIENDTFVPSGMISVVSSGKVLGGLLDEDEVEVVLNCDAGMRAKWRKKRMRRLRRKRRKMRQRAR